VKSAASRLLSSAQLLHMRSRWLLPPQFSGFLDALTEYHRLPYRTNGRRTRSATLGASAGWLYCNSNENLEKNWLEWLVRFVSFSLSICWGIWFDGATSSNAPPSIEFQLGTPQPRSNHFLVVSVTNRGDETAEGVHVEVVLVDRGKEQESGFEIAFLPTLHPRRVGDIETDPRTVEEMKARCTGL